MKKVLLALAFLGALAPAAFTIYKAGGFDNWQGVLPKGTTDSLYYYARIKEVVDGHPLNGNPYVYEYRDTFAPAFFIPDIVSAIPMLIGFPFSIGVLLNVFVWSFIFLLLSFNLFRLLKFPKNWALLWSVILYISSYSFMLRPTIMQLIYPLFLAFLIAFVRFLEEPTERKRAVWLSIIAASTFYFYTYLAYIALLSLILAFFWYLYTKRYKELKALTRVGLLSALFLIPFGIYTWIQISGLSYLETLTRIGLVYTRIPTIEAYFYGRWIVIGLVVAWLLPNRHKVFWFSTGLGLLFSILLNVFTGAELLLGVHIGRFIILWMVLILGELSYEWYSRRSLLPAIFLLVLSLGVARNVSRGLDFFCFDNRGEKTADVQVYAAPLSWLEENVSEESVVQANELISEYIPIITQHYPVYFHGAALHNISTKELEERQLSPEKFNAKYLIIDRDRDDKKPLSLDKALYDDGRFAILLIQ